MVSLQMQIDVVNAQRAYLDAKHKVELAQIDDNLAKLAASKAAEDAAATQV